MLVVPIALAGVAAFAGTGVHPDTYVLRLPLLHGQTALALLVYIGGFSAATGMVIVASVAFWFRTTTGNLRSVVPPFA